MKICLVRSGGLAGMRREVTVDTERLDASRRAELHRAVEAAEREGLFRQASVHREQAQRDRFRYRLTVEDGRGRRETQFSEEEASRSAEVVVEAVWKAAEESPDPGSRPA